MITRQRKGFRDDFYPVVVEPRILVKGFLAETWDPVAPGGALSAPSATGASSTLVATLIEGLHAGDTVTSLAAFCGTVGASVTLTKLALFSKTGVLLGVTADLTASLVANTYLTGALTTPYAVTSEDAFYAGILIISSVTAPTILRGASLTGIGAVVNSGVRPNMQVAAQTDITGNVTPANSSNAYWFAAL